MEEPPGSHRRETQLACGSVPQSWNDTERGSPEDEHLGQTPFCPPTLGLLGFERISSSK